MSLQPFLFAILGFAIVNGLFSPLFPLVYFGLTPLAVGFLVSIPSIHLLMSSLILSTLTIMLAGVPAALYERATGAAESTVVSMWIWLAGTALLTLPAILQVLGLGLI